MRVHVWECIFGSTHEGTYMGEHIWDAYMCECSYEGTYMGVHMSACMGVLI